MNTVDSSLIRDLLRLCGRGIERGEPVTDGDAETALRDAIQRLMLARAVGVENEGFSMADEIEAERAPAAPMLARSLETYRERRRVYGESEQRFADTMMALHPHGLCLRTRADWVRYGIYHQIVGKLTRYDFHNPHVDTVHDLQPYSAMLEAEDRRLLGLAPFARVVKKPEDLPG